MEVGKDMEDKDNFFDDYGLRRIVNASGTMTALGASPVKDEVIAEMERVLPRWVEIDELQKRTGEVISEATGAEAGFVTACAAAGITLSVAACMTGKDLGNIQQLPNAEGMKDEVIIQKGHAVNYGATINQGIRLAGAKPVEFGSVSGTSSLEMKGAIKEQTAAAMFVVSHHTVQYGMIPFDQFVDIAHDHDLPVIVDAAAEYSFSDYIRGGGDLVTCSGHKFLFGPTAGLLAGKRELIDACRLQETGIGRTMKVGKEGMVGLIAALRVWDKRDLESEHTVTLNKARKVIGRLEKVKGIRPEAVEDPTGNPITRVQVNVEPDEAGLDAFIVSSELRKNSPPIHTRAHHTDEGYFQLELRFLDSEQLDSVCEKIEEIFKTGEKAKGELRDKYSPRTSVWDSMHRK